MTDTRSQEPEWTHEDRRTFRASLYRVVKARPDFLNRFYELFLASSPEVREKFVNVDMQRQKAVVKKSFYLLVSAATDRAHWALEQLDQVALRHHNLGINSEHYALWRKTLITVVRESDPQFDENVERSWHAMATFGIHYLHHRRLSHMGRREENRDRTVEKAAEKLIEQTKNMLADRWEDNDDEAVYEQLEVFSSGLLRKHDKEREAIVGTALEILRKRIWNAPK